MYLSGQWPSLPELLKLKLHHSVGAKYKIFGIFLLNDIDGSAVDKIEEDYYGNIECIIIKILQSWLADCGRAVTWWSLVETLRECRLPALAKQIENTKMKGTHVLCCDY